MNFLTDFADEAVIIPLAAAVAFGLMLAGWRRGAMAWVVAVAGTLVVILVLKLSFADCTDGPVRSPSGHAAAAAVVYGGLAALFGAPPLLAGGGAALVIGVTRVALGMHVPAEVLIGGTVGTFGAVAMRRLAGPRPPLHSAWLPAAVGLAVIVVFHGLRLPSEAAIRAGVLAYNWPFAVCHRG